MSHLSKIDAHARFAELAVCAYSKKPIFIQWLTTPLADFRHDRPSVLVIKMLDDRRKE